MIGRQRWDEKGASQVVFQPPDGPCGEGNYRNKGLQLRLAGWQVDRQSSREIER